MEICYNTLILWETLTFLWSPASPIPSVSVWIGGCEHLTDEETGPETEMLWCKPPWGKPTASMEAETKPLNSSQPQRSTHVIIWVSTPASTRAPSTKRGTEVKPYLSQEWPSSKLTLGWKQVHGRESWRENHTLSQLFFRLLNSPLISFYGSLDYQ